MQGWYEGDAERMRRCLTQSWPNERYCATPQTGEERFHHLNQQQMVAKTQQGGGSDTPSNKQFYDTIILDVYGEIASVKAESYEYIQLISYIISHAQAYLTADDCALAYADSPLCSIPHVGTMLY